MTGLSDKVLEKIKSGHARPKPRWRFVLFRNLVLLVIGAALLVSAASVSLIIHLIDSFEISRLIGRPGWFRLMLASFPYVWMVIFLTVTVVGIAEFLRTKRGYRYRLLHVASGFSILVLAFGGTAYVLGGGSMLENYLEKKIPAYSALMHTPQKFWSQPDEGLISGEIIKTDLENKEMEIKDWEGNIWNVDYSDALWRGQAENASGEETKIIGEVKEGGKFEAEEVRPWNGRGKVRGAEKKGNSLGKKKKSNNELKEYDGQERLAEDENADNDENEDRDDENDARQTENDD